MFKLLVVDATNRVHVLGRANPTRVPERFCREVKRTSSMLGGAVPILCWDHPQGSASRKEAEPRYKAGREENADVAEDVRQSLVEAQKQYCCWFDPRVEADDLVATCVRLAPADWPLVIHSTDSDLFALLDRGVRLQLTTSTSDGAKLRFINRDDVEQKFGVRMEQFCEYRGLVGDSSDNLPGVDGVGDKTARQILGQFDTVEEAVAAGDNLQISPARRKALRTGWENGAFRDAMAISRLVVLDELPPNVTQAFRLAAELKPSGRYNAKDFRSLVMGDKPRPPF